MAHTLGKLLIIKAGVEALRKKASSTRTVRLALIKNATYLVWLLLTYDIAQKL